MAYMSIRKLLKSTSPFSILFSPFSSISQIPQIPQLPIPLFLLTECHFSPTQISKIIQTKKSLLQTKSPHTAREVVEFLKQWGFAQPQLHTTILKYPTLLTFEVDTHFKPKIHYFLTLGFADQELKSIISICPRVLGQSLENNTIPKILFLENLFGGKPNLIKALKKSPSLLIYSIEKDLKPKLDFLKQWGIQGELLSSLHSANSNILVKFSVETLRKRMEYARNTMGIGQGSTKFVSAIRALLSNGPESVERKMKHLQCLGFLEGEVCEILKKNPILLTYSTNKMQENMEFLTQTAGLKQDVVVLNSCLLHYNLKKRLLPRYAVFKALSSEE